MLLLIVAEKVLTRALQCIASPAGEKGTYMLFVYIKYQNEKQNKTDNIFAIF